MIILVTIAALIVLVIIAAALSTLQNKEVHVAEYEIGADDAGFIPINIVLISDLHRAQFGEHNQQLVNKTAEQHPDLIMIAGDMLERNRTDAEIEEFASLLDRLMEIAPVYLSRGNHDMNIYAGDIVDPYAVELIQNTGAVILDNDYAAIDVNGYELRIGGSLDYAFADDTQEKWLASEAYAFYSDFVNTDRYKIMLSHRPDSFIFGDAADVWDIDLVLCGHTHNGVIAFPWGKAVYAPDQGIFPKYSRGYYELGRIRMLICGGLAGNRGIPRVFNPPEIVRLTLYPDQQ